VPSVEEGAEIVLVNTGEDDNSRVDFH
jgi:hypothetical protein